jgi:hypothetical protein
VECRRLSRLALDTVDTYQRHVFDVFIGNVIGVTAAKIMARQPRPSRRTEELDT